MNYESIFKYRLILKYPQKSFLIAHLFPGDNFIVRLLKCSQRARDEAVWISFGI